MSEIIETIQNRIKYKSDLYEVFGVSRKTFDKKHLSGLLAHLDMKMEDWKRLSHSTFTTEQSIAIHEYLKSLSDRLG